MNASPVVNFSGLSVSYCINVPAAILSGNQGPGSLFTGTGITNNGNGTATFNPATAGPGMHTILYSYTAVNGCSNSTSQTVTVNALPVVSFSGLLPTYSTADAATTLIANHPGGIFSGPGITNMGNGTANFNPAMAGTGGPYTITYSYTDPITGCSNNTSQQVSVIITASIQLFLQGYYTGNGIMQPVLNNQAVPLSLAGETDTVIVELHNPVTFDLVDSKAAPLLTDGTVSAIFNRPAGSYYIAIKHRNTLQTWSADPVNFTSSTPLYNFSIAASKAFGGNQVEVEPGVWAFFTGDMNQDEYIDGNDFPLYDAESASGGLYDGTYTSTDMNGDGFVDGNDFPVFDLNSSNGVSSMHP